MFAVSSLPEPPSILLARLTREAPGLRLPRGRALTWADAGVHRDAFTADPALYALSSLAPHVPSAQRARVLFCALAGSWASLDAETRRTVSRVVRVLLASLPVEDVLTVFLALRRARANHKHVARAIAHYLTEHPHAEDIARARRRGVRDALEHALGRDVVRGAYKLGKKLPHVRDQERARSLLAILYGARDALVRLPLASIQTHARFTSILGDAARELPKTVHATNRGDVSATLVHMYRGGATEALRRALDEYGARSASLLPSFDGTIALVLDASASMQGYGEREYCAIAQSVALARVFARVCPKLRVFQVGGTTGDLPRPEGVTDLASALLDAAACEPDVIAIVTDGYENRTGGDLADVARALPSVGVHAPVVVCHAKFTHKDDLSLRRVGLAEIGFWHEDDFHDVLVALASRARPSVAARFLRRALADRLSVLEKVGEPWITAP
jgi:hypothetical protein